MNHASAAHPAALAAFGPLAPYLNDASVTDVFVNGHTELWVDRGGGAERVGSWSCPSEQLLREFAVRLVAQGGRHLDDSAPCVDVRVEGARVHVVLPPVAVRGTTISIRAARDVDPRLDELEVHGLFGLGPAAAVRRQVVEHAVAARVNLLITGAGGVGNTTWNL